MVVTKDGAVWVSDFGYLHLNRIVGFEKDMVKTAFGRVWVSYSQCELLKAAYREWKVREVLAKIVQTPDSPPSVAEEAKALLRFLDE